MISKKKFLSAILAISIVAALAVGTTIAWLTDKTDPVENTFTVGDIEITLTESDNLDLKMMPGKTITKDPVITVERGSEACWLFVKIDKGGDFDKYMTYGMAEGWTELEPGVFYRPVEASDNKQEFAVLASNHVLVKDTVTAADMETAETTPPTLTFTAYAVQSEGVDDPAVAWGYANPTTP